MRTDNQSDALLCFASSHDANYPPEQNYVFHIHSLLPPTRDEVLALYTFMHLIDDIADNPSDDKPTRHDNVMRFVRSTSRFLQTGADPFAALNTCLLEDAALLALLETVQELNSVGKVEFPAISGLAAAVSLPNLWPDHPHIASFAEFDSYNETLFGAVSACLHLSIFSRCAPSRIDLYRCGFKDFMKGMQVINILMDLEEDVLAGHYLLPKSYYSGSDYSRIKRAAFRELMLYADACFNKANFLTTDEEIPEDIRCFFKGLKNIHTSLSRHESITVRLDD